MGMAWIVSELIKHFRFSWLRSVWPWKKVKVNIINTWCISMSEEVPVPSLMMMTSIVSQESLPRNTDRQTDRQTHTDTHTQTRVSSTQNCGIHGQLVSLPSTRYPAGNLQDGCVCRGCLRAPLVGAQGYQRLPLFKPVEGRNTVLRAEPAYRASTYLVSAFPTHST